LEITEVTLGIPVVDLTRSRDWYERLLGFPPELEPVAGMAEFRIAGTWLQLREVRVSRPGWSFRIGVRNLDAEFDRLRADGFDPTEIETVPGVIRFVRLTDPDGNTVSLYELLPRVPAPSVP
jgi:catechol 2,3-dioxygenase-like lactoylglutathione lyase family enzyme